MLVTVTMGCWAAATEWQVCQVSVGPSVDSVGHRKRDPGVPRMPGKVGNGPVGTGAAASVDGPVGTKAATLGDLWLHTHPPRKACMACMSGLSLVFSFF